MDIHCFSKKQCISLVIQRIKEILLGTALKGNPY